MSTESDDGGSGDLLSSVLEKVQGESSIKSDSGRFTIDTGKGILAMLPEVLREAAAAGSKSYPFPVDAADMTPARLFKGARLRGNAKRYYDHCKKLGLNPQLLKNDSSWAIWLDLVAIAFSTTASPGIRNSIRLGREQRAKEIQGYWNDHFNSLPQVIERAFENGEQLVFFKWKNYPEDEKDWAVTYFMAQLRAMGFRIATGYFSQIGAYAVCLNCGERGTWEQHMPKNVQDAIRRCDEERRRKAKNVEEVQSLLKASEAFNLELPVEIWQQALERIKGVADSEKLRADLVFQLGIAFERSVDCQQALECFQEYGDMQRNQESGNQLAIARANLNAWRCRLKLGVREGVTRALLNDIARCEDVNERLKLSEEVASLYHQFVLNAWVAPEPVSQSTDSTNTASPPEDLAYIWSD